MQRDRNLALYPGTFSFSSHVYANVTHQEMWGTSFPVLTWTFSPNPQKHFFTSILQIFSQIIDFEIIDRVREAILGDTLALHVVNPV